MSELHPVTPLPGSARHLRPVTGLLYLILSAACGTTSSTIPGADVSDVYVDAAPGTELTITRQASISTVALPGSRAELWPALVSAYEEYGLPVTGADAGSHLLVSGGARLRRIAGQPVDRYFDCPGTAYGNSATTGDTYVNVQAQLLPTDSVGTDLRMQVEATSVTRSGNRSRCRSTGRLERMLRVKLGGPDEAGFRP